MASGKSNLPRPGFTLIEALVVIAILGLLMAIVIPAVMHVRESGRRAQCANRLRQLGLAIHGHQNVTGTFPPPMPPRIVVDGERWTEPEVISGYYELLPYLEQASLYDAINMGFARNNSFHTFTYKSAQNRTVTATRLDILLCPSDSETETRTAPVSFRFNLGFANPVVPWSGLLEGAFDPATPIRPSEIRDGLSHTTGFSERFVGSGSPNRFDRERDIWAAGVLDLFPIETNDHVLQVCRSLQGQPGDFTTAIGDTWLASGNRYIWYNHVATPNEQGADCIAGRMNSSEVDYCEYCSMAARSAHPGGVHGLQMDGAVRFIRNGIAPHVWRALGSRAGGETVTAESF